MPPRERLEARARRALEDPLSALPARGSISVEELKRAPYLRELRARGWADLTEISEERALGDEALPAPQSTAATSPFAEEERL